MLVRVVADGLEWSYGWKAPAAQRMRFVLDFCYSTGLRANELVSATLGQLERDRKELAWLRVRGEGNREGRVGEAFKRRQ
jgi:site-specific recombinase XerD